MMRRGIWSQQPAHAQAVATAMPGHLAGELVGWRAGIDSARGHLYSLIRRGVMAIRKSCILLVEPNPDLHELEEQVLTDAGYQVEPTPAGADPVMVAEQTHPDLIVMGLPYKHPEEWQVIDRLQAAPETRKIPLVVITTSEREAAAAQAAPTARYTVVAPYDISALETAAREALQSPPPAAVLPPAKSPVSPAVSFATDTLSQQARHLVL